MIDKKSKDIVKKAATILVEDAWSHEISFMHDIKAMAKEEYKDLNIFEKIECVFKYCKCKERVSRAFRKVYKMCKRDIEYSHDIIEAYERRLYLEFLDQAVDNLDCVLDWRGPLFPIGEPHPLLEETNDEYRDN